MVIGVLGWMGKGVGRNWRKLVLGCVVAGLVGLAFYWGHNSAQCQTPAPTPSYSGKPCEMVPDAPLAPDSRSDYSRRVVAYINKNVPITREDLGEFLIARYGADKVEALVNRRIVDLACQARGIVITDAEVEAALAHDLQGLGGLTQKDFETKLLKPRGTSLFQWREDVIRPRLALTQYCRDRVKVTEDDIQKAFENRFGPKVKCRMILLRKEEGRKHLEIWTKINKNPDAFDEEARKQFVPALAARGGEIPPICQHCGDDNIEKAAFHLKPGEISPLIGSPDGTIILKCVEHIPKDTTHQLDKERATLEKEILDRKIMEEIPKVLKELRVIANPQFFIKRPMTDAEFKQGVRQTAADTPPNGAVTTAGHKD
jgi:hypothetical protein